MTKLFHGVIRGRTIELTEDPGVVDGQQVEIIIKHVPIPRPWGEGILRTAGALADDPEWDDIMEELYQARKMDRRPQLGGMTHLLDTNICSAHMRRPGGLAHRFFQHAGGLAISTVILAELFAGAYKRPSPDRLLSLIADLLQEVDILAFDEACAQEFGKVNGRLMQQGISVPNLDLMIASVALVHDLTLVTHNTADFRNIPNLRLEDWLHALTRSIVPTSLYSQPG